jgi:predicted transcriptional regulator|tara:strand:+ start:218 stop:370 length:153 start_codon:yes stop_codon:yes gene_type:complete
MNLAEIKKRLEEAYNQEDWNIVEDLIDVLDTYITLGEDNIIDDWDDEEID